jgi:hypothetical protein
MSFLKNNNNNNNKNKNQDEGFEGGRRRERKGN